MYDFFDFAEDYERVRAFFDGEQREIFTRALDMLAIYEDSKTYIVDKDLEDAVAQMRQIVRMDAPYKEIPKLPELRTKFMNAYAKVLKAEQAPVMASIDDNCKRIMDVLQTKPYAEKKHDEWFRRFREIKDGAEHCNNVSTLRSYADKADALKLRLLNEMDQMDAELEATPPSGVEVPPDTEEVHKVKVEKRKKKTKNVSIKTMAKTASWRLESAQDVESYLDALRQSLLTELKDNDIVNVEL